MMRVTITTSNSGTPTAHKEGCRDLARVRQTPDYETEWTADYDSLAQLSLAYWHDIITYDCGLTGKPALMEALNYLSEIKVAPCVTLPRQCN